MGFRTEQFARGKEFLSTSNLREFSCLILDMQLPGMNGLELQLRLAAASHPIPIILSPPLATKVCVHGRCEAAL
jgi:FixJ family two-component response regulator